MKTLRDLIPDAETLCGLPAPILAGSVLESLTSISGDDRQYLHREQFCVGHSKWYSKDGNSYDRIVGLKCNEAWEWLRTSGLICEDYERPGWYYVTELGLEVGDRADVAAFVAASEMPIAFLHPTIARLCRGLFLQGRIDTAVFEAFKAVEVGIREAAGLGNDLFGVRLAAAAFAPEDGPLTDIRAERSERVALLNLMSGAIGSYKNPVSHRRVALEPAEAREMIILASHLLKVVDARRRARSVTPSR